MGTHWEGSAIPGGLGWQTQFFLNSFSFLTRSLQSSSFALFPSCRRAYLLFHFIAPSLRSFDSLKQRNINVGPSDSDWRSCRLQKFISGVLWSYFASLCCVLMRSSLVRSCAVFWSLSCCCRSGMCEQSVDNQSFVRQTDGGQQNCSWWWNWK